MIEREGVEHRISEIFRPVDKDHSDLVVREMMRDLRRRIVEQKESFDGLARAFSQSVPRRDGMVTWVGLIWNRWIDGLAEYGQ